MSSEERRALDKLKKEKSLLTARLKELKDAKNGQVYEFKHELDNIAERISLLNKSDQGASLDSEITLVLMDEYPYLSGPGRWCLSETPFIGPLNTVINNYEDAQGNFCPFRLIANLVLLQ